MTIGFLGLSKVTGLLFHPENFIPIGGHGLLELGDLDLAIIIEAFGMLVFEVEVQGGIAEIDLVTVALVAGSLPAVPRFPTPAFLHVRVVEILLLRLAAHFLFVVINWLLIYKVLYNSYNLL